MNDRNRTYVRIIGCMVSAILLSVAQAASDNSVKATVISNQSEASGTSIKLYLKVPGKGTGNGHHVIATLQGIEREAVTGIRGIGV